MLQFKTIENIMMTICASDKHSLTIVYEDIGGSGGGKIHIWWVSASNYVDHDQTLQRAVKPRYTPLSNGNSREQ